MHSVFTLSSQIPKDVWIPFLNLLREPRKSQSFSPRFKPWAITAKPKSEIRNLYPCLRHRLHDNAKF